MKYVILFSIIIIATLAAFLPGTAFIVKGKVTNVAGLSVQYTTVSEKGATNSTQTDAAGNFSISVKTPHAILIFSAAGYTSQTFSIAGKSIVAVTLQAITQNLEEVVVAGYGAARKKNITGAAYEARDMALQGKVAGIQITSYAAAPSAQKTQRGKSKIFQDDHFNTEDYDGIKANSFLSVKENPLSTFSIDVDAASYSNVRRFLNNGQLPPAGAVRIEEMINYFHYNYPQPEGKDPFSIHTESSVSPWNKAHRLVLVSLQGKKIPTPNLPPSNLIFLIDVSGSMEDENKLPLVRQSMKLLTDQLREQDRVAIVVYAGNAGVVLPSTSGSSRQSIKEAIDRLEAGGSTAGGEGIKLAYKIATENFLKDGNNRVILCTDGDFNVGMSSDDDMERLIEQERKSGVFLTVLGYGMGNYKDNKMQKLADKGNGNHAYIDNISEAKKVLVHEFGGTLFTIAKDVKLQVEFNPAKVQAYRLIGYENRMLNKEDFNNDKKDAGELGSGHTVTALYEIIPAGVKSDFIDKIDPLKYQSPLEGNKALSPELMTIKFRYKDPGGTISRLIEHAVTDNGIALDQTSDNFRFAAAVAQFGMLLRNDAYQQQSSYKNILTLANSAIGNDVEGYRKEFLGLVRKADRLKATGKEQGEEVEISFR